MDALIEAALAVRKNAHAPFSHFAVGAAKTLTTVRSWRSSGWEMTAVGAVESTCPRCLIQPAAAS